MQIFHRALIFSCILKVLKIVDESNLKNCIRLILNTTESKNIFCLISSFVTNKINFYLYNNINDLV